VLRQERLPGRLARLLAARLRRRRRPSLSELSTARLRELARSSLPSEQALLGAYSPARLRPAEVLAAATSEDLIGPLALLFDNASAEPGERSEALHQAIVLDSASLPHRRHCALLCVRRHAEEITAAHARAILTRCLNLAAQPVDPYAPVVLAMTARTAAAALLAADDSLDQIILNQLESSPRARELALIQATALQTRGSGFGPGLSAVLDALKPKEAQALGFARDCDRNYSALQSAAPPPGRLDHLLIKIRRPAAQVGTAARGLGRLIVVLALPASAALLALLIDPALIDLPDDLRISGGGALTALGILIAVHVLSAELAANRLAGPIARVTSFPVPLQAGYVAGLALLLRSLLSPPRSELATYSAVALGLVAALIVLVLVSLLTLLRRTDPVKAVAAFTRRREGPVLRAGWRLGRLQRRALAGRELLAGYPFFKSRLSTPLGEQRAPITAPRSGYLHLSLRRLRRLARTELWRTERARLILVKPLGIEISRGEEAISLVPAADVRLKPRDMRRARRLVKVRRGNSIDAVAEYVGVLIGITATQAEAGNQGGAGRIRDATLKLLEVHLDAMRASRDRGSKREETVGMAAVLRVSAVQALRLLGGPLDANTREILTGFLQRLLEITDQADGFSTALATQLGRRAQQLDDALTAQLLWDCAVQALRVEDDFSLRQTREQVEHLGGSAEWAVDLGGRIVQLAAITWPSEAERLWEWHLRRVAKETIFPVTAIRVGASALRVGNASLALSVALALRNHDAAKWREFFDDHSTADRETIRDDLYGSMLGPDAQFALLEFVDFSAAQSRRSLPDQSREGLP
jgi:hypothetical protein